MKTNSVFAREAGISAGGRGVDELWRASNGWNPDIDRRRTAPWDRDVFAKIQIDLSTSRGKVTLATLDATDTAGFVAALGNWVTNTAVFRG